MSFVGPHSLPRYERLAIMWAANVSVLDIVVELDFSSENNLSVTVCRLRKTGDPRLVRRRGGRRPSMAPRVVRLMAAGLRPTVIAERLGITRNLVSCHASLARLRGELPALHRPVYPAWTPERVMFARSQWAIGRSAAEIARDLKTTRNAVYMKLHRMGLSRYVKRRRAA